MGFRDIKGSLTQFSLYPTDPREEQQARIEQIIAESAHISGFDEETLSLSVNETSEEWTVVYDKFQVHRR